MTTTTADTCEYAYPTPTLEEVYAELAWPKSTVLVSIEHARRLIAESRGALTWFDASATWARLAKAHPNTRYPVL